jgi:hypothetical protein
MSYLSNYPSIQYVLKNKEYSLKDIFRRVAFSSKDLNNPKIFSDYYVVDGETFEQISQNVYGEVDLFWILILANNIISNLELPRTEQEIQTTIDTKYSGAALFFHEYLLGLKAGDIVAKVSLSGGISSEGTTISDVDTSKYSIIKDYDPTFRVVWIKDENVFAVNDILGFFSLDSSNNWTEFNFRVKLVAPGNIIERSFAQLRKISQYKNVPVQFNDANGNYSSPYITPEIEVPSNAIGTYSSDDDADIGTISNTDLHSYVRGRGTLFSSITTLNRQIVDENQKFRIIKILNPAYLNRVLEGINNLIYNNDIKTLTINIEN